MECRCRPRAEQIVVGGYSPRAYEDLFWIACAKAGLNLYFLDMVNLGEQVAWVHGKEEATDAAVSQITMAVERARHLEPIPIGQYSVISKALLVRRW